MAINPTPIPKSARAVIQPDYNSKDLTLPQLPVPELNPNSNEHLIRVHTMAPCNGELLWAKNYPKFNYSNKEPVVGCDLAGIIVAVPNSSPFRLGDEVGLGDIDTAPAKGKRILITAASGGCGGWMVQLACIAGAEVIGTCGPNNIEMVKGLGAKEVLNYRTTDFHAWGQDPQNKVDVVIDCVGGKSLGDAWWTIKDGGVLVSIAQPPEQVRPTGYEGKDVRNFFFIMQPEGVQLERISKLIDLGKCKAAVDSVWRLEDYEKVFQRADGGHAAGKVVIDMLLAK